MQPAVLSQVLSYAASTSNAVAAVAAAAAAAAAAMADSLDPGSPGLERRRSKNPLKNMMQHLTVDMPDDENGPRRGSLMRRLSWRRSRSPSVHSDASAPASAAPSASARNADPALCAACAGLAADVEAALDEADSCFAKAVNPGADDAFDNDEYFLSWLRGLAENRWAATCPLCQLFWAVRVEGDGDGDGDYCLAAFSSRDTNYLVDPGKMFDMGHPAKAKARGLAPGFLGVVPKKKGPGASDPRVSGDWFRGSGMLYRTMPEAMVEPPRGTSPSAEGCTPEPPSLALNDASWLQQGVWGREIGRRADMSVARDWLRFCESHHQGRCGRPPVLADMPGFRLIDCTKSPLQVVPRPLREDYVALSYVLGTNITEPWPTVVVDAAAVTRELGIRYLWVDRLCVDGSRPQERAQHISRMDEVFEGAVLTIIAAHGHDAMQGLPGVGSTPRPAQPTYRFADADTTLVSSLRDPRLSIQASTWYTRGWTYQEGLLARRRLVFTAQQTYWECEGMACPETLVLPLALYHDAAQQRMCDFMRPGLFNGVSYVDGSWEAWKRLASPADAPSTLSIFRAADQHIAAYTRRQLTLDEDSLSAFRGIERRLEGTLGRGKLGSLVGIPIWAPGPGDAATRPGPPRTKDLFALSTSFWHHRGDDEPRRRPHLPSWTWAGWAGAVELFSSIVVADPGGAGRPRKLLNHHYVSATQLTRNDASSLGWTYSPDVVVLRPDGSLAYDFGPRPGPPPALPPGRYRLRVSDPLVLDRVKARAHAGGWLFNDLSVDVRLSRGARGTAAGPGPGSAPGGIREYVERHARGEQMTVLWFAEEATVLLLVVERTPAGAWERVGRARMAFAQEPKEVVRRFGRLEVMLNYLPLRRLGEDIIIE
ncbi:hypothetical protein TOPH_02903 [Tolypocladium ophioglossoides CBS 100239]|uniref:Heterokaryon incompatibility domain-containing protein n=1 Tax=Tolypocladium ophioglossoides (strain CBS 100239) TaxID=1163406 RepID=A0A0L0ND73_TOLOC|nr:hypothetical protein TOPH_02903 [Tolypocladium ophioglossoides CBS 100239]